MAGLNSLKNCIYAKIAISDSKVVLSRHKFGTPWPLGILDKQIIDPNKTKRICSGFTRTKVDLKPQITIWYGKILYIYS